MDTNGKVIWQSDDGDNTNDGLTPETAKKTWQGALDACEAPSCDVTIYPQKESIMDNQETAQHTPGPWGYETPDTGAARVFVGENDDDGVLVTLSDDYDLEERDANARLIAAAPSLLSACEFVKVWLMAPALNAKAISDMQRLCENAIAKARP